MNQIELAYLAGVVDSDGCLTIAVERWRQRNLGIAPAYQEMVSIGQNKPHAVELAKELFGGSISMQKPRGMQGQPMYRWQAHTACAARCVAALFPYLRLKKDAARLILDLRAIKDRGREANTEPFGPRIRRIRPAVAIEMADLAAKIREFNRPLVPLPLG